MRLGGGVLMLATGQVSATQINADQTFAEDTVIENTDPRTATLVYLLNGSNSMTIHVAEGKTLTLRQANPWSPNNGTAYYSQAKVINGPLSPGRSITFTGGHLVVEMPMTTDEASGTNNDERMFLRATDSSGIGEVRFKNQSVLFQGSVVDGLGLAGPGGVVFDNGFTMNIDRRQDAVSQFSSGIVCQVKSDVRFDKTAEINILAGAKDTGAYGITLTYGGSVTANGDLTVNIDGGNGESFEWARGIHTKDFVGYDTGKALTFEGTVDVAIKNAVNAQAYGFNFASARNYDFKKAVTVNVDSVKSIYGLYSASRVTADTLTFNLKQVGEQAIAVYMGDGSLSAEALTADIDMADDANGWAVYAAGNAKVDFKKADIRISGGNSYGVVSNDTSIVTVTDDLQIAGADNALVSYDNSHIEVEGGFTSETPAWISAQDNSYIRVNCNEMGLVKFTGAVETADGAYTVMFLGNAASALEDVSHWTVTDASQISWLKMGRRSALNFQPLTEEGVELNTFVNADGDGNRHAMITVTGDNPLLLYSGSDKQTSVTLAAEWGELAAGDEVNLVASNAGFALNDIGNLLTAGTDLNELKTDAVVTQTYSLARQTTDVLSADRYDLSLKTDGLLIATIKDVPVPTPDPSDDQLNPETGALMESSLSAYGTLFAADDLLVDTVLRSRNGGYEGAFAAARAGRWHFDTNTTQKANIVSGLVGYAAKTDAGEFGTYLEMGHASYKTKTAVEGDMVSGSGKHNYAGLGLYANVPLPVEGWQVTGYLKAGVLENNFDTTLADQKVNFDRTSAYWGGHLGTHYDFEVADFRLRPFVSYFYDGRDSETYRKDGHDGIEGASFRYDTLEAHRVQVGTMAEYRYSDRVRPYLGLTYEQVLAAEAKGHASDSEGRMNLRTSDMEGGTGILSAGWSYENAAKDFSCEFGMNGFTGTRRGVSAQIQADWRF